MAILPWEKRWEEHLPGWKCLRRWREREIPSQNIEISSFCSNQRSYLLSRKYLGARLGSRYCYRTGIRLAGRSAIMSKKMAGVMTRATSHRAQGGTCKVIILNMTSQESLQRTHVINAIRSIGEGDCTCQRKCGTRVTETVKKVSRV